MAGLTKIVLSPTFLILGTFFFIALNLLAFILATLRPKNFPPGPRGFPGVGNLLQLHRTFPFLTYSSWARRYGNDTPLGIKKGSTNVVVLNSRRVVAELFEQRGALYNDRPWEYMSGTWVHKTDLRAAVFQNSSPWLIRWRREFAHFFGPGALTRHRAVYEAETSRLLVKLKDSPDARRAQLQDILLTWIMSVPCIGVCGKRPDEMDKYGFSIKHFRQCSIDYAALIAPQPFDIFPVLRYLPDSFGMARWKEKARSVRKGVFDCGTQFLSAAGEQREALDAGKTNGSESMLASMLREQRDNKDQTFTTADIGNTAFHVVTAGSGTSLAFMSVVLMILAKYPEVQTRLREEVLRITSNLPPTVSDIADLKYMDAVWNEVHRWRSVTPQAFPRATSQDDVYDGFHIPKGTTVLINAWHIHHSEEDYDRPDEFIPERYLRHPLGMRPELRDKTEQGETAASRVTFVFGTGRRICPGMHAAKQNLLLGLAKILWAFDILPPEGEATIDLSMETGFVFENFFLRPKDFDVVLRMREKRSADDISKHYSDAYQAEAEFLGW
ncbi:cytochrome P450 [Dissoconium aciculare CBS 342.82]|uniref:Cytochrome P450 n=1 Tax=Dissoconium aciculare CBS 342.82 TaxID=1314786 RepID=A0A6J3MFN5_9PEZI|nr:cytochrome P450 [Dissoconium aciculare CBS 342.82]KAF1826658.1 cytochrome P450 [Dissoconium aciculare CBS 342.82]